MISPELLQVCQSYLDRRLTLSQLEEWLIPLLPSLAQESNSGDAEISATIEQGLAEMTDRITTEVEFRDTLQHALGRQSLVVNWFLGNYDSHSFDVRSGSSNQYVRILRTAASSTTDNPLGLDSLPTTTAGVGAGVP